MAKTRVRVAVLDGEDRLIGYEFRAPMKTDIVVSDDCDLPADGSYQYRRGSQSFMPLDHGHGKPMRAPAPDTYVLYHLCKRLHNDLPQECRDWCKWYEATLQERDVKLVNTDFQRGK